MIEPAPTVLLQSFTGLTMSGIGFEIVLRGAADKRTVNDIGDALRDVISVMEAQAEALGR